MSKKSSTIHVEEYVWDEIDNIQKNYNISSRNTAIEYLVAEYRGLKNKNNNDDVIKNDIDKKDKSKDPLADKLKQMEDDMR